MIDFFTILYIYIKVTKLNETTLSFDSYETNGSPSTTPVGGFAGTYTKTDTETGSVVFMPGGKPPKLEGISVSYCFK